MSKSKRVVSKWVVSGCVRGEYVGGGLSTRSVSKLAWLFTVHLMSWLRLG